jgi:hypothetical protein
MPVLAVERRRRILTSLERSPATPYRVCDLSDLDGIVTDVPFPDGPEWAGLARRLNVLASGASPP